MEGSPPDQGWRAEQPNLYAASKRATERPLPCISAGRRAVIYQHIRLIGRLVAPWLWPNASRPTVFLCSGARVVNVRICRGPVILTVQDRLRWRSARLPSALTCVTSYSITTPPGRGGNAIKTLEATLPTA